MKTTIILVAGGFLCFAVGVTVGYLWFESQRPLEIREAGDSVKIRTVGDPATSSGAVSIDTESDNGRVARFVELDTNRDGKLTKAEFSVGRGGDSETWFIRRDVDDDGFISRAEFLPGMPLPRPPPKATDPVKP